MNAGPVGSGYAGSLVFQTKPADGNETGNLATAMTIDYAGRVGIGTTSPRWKLTTAGAMASATTDFVFGSAGSVLVMGMGAATGNTYASFDSFTSGGSGFGNIVFHPTSNGSVGIGTTDPKAKLEVAGDVKIGDNASATCAAASDEGKIKYSGGHFQGCISTGWKQLDN